MTFCIQIDRLIRSLLTKCGLVTANFGSSRILPPVLCEPFTWTNIDILHQWVKMLVVQYSKVSLVGSLHGTTALPVRMSHYNDAIMSAMASQISSLTIVYSTVYSGANLRKYKSPASLAFVRGIHRWPMNSPHKRPVTRKMFPFDDVIMIHTVGKWFEIKLLWDIIEGHREQEHVKWCGWLELQFSERSWDVGG